MLSRSNRLRRRNDFARVYKKGTTTHARLFSIKHAQNQLGHPRIGIVVSTKVSKRAVIRNRLRRRFYAQMRHLLLQINGGVDIVIMVRHSAIDQESAQIARDLEKALTRAHLLSEVQKT